MVDPRPPRNRARKPRPPRNLRECPYRRGVTHYALTEPAWGAGRDRSAAIGRADRPPHVGRLAAPPASGPERTLARAGWSPHPRIRVEDPPAGERPGRLQGA